MDLLAGHFLKSLACSVRSFIFFSQTNDVYSCIYYLIKQKNKQQIPVKFSGFRLRKKKKPDYFPTLTCLGEVCSDDGVGNGLDFRGMEVVVVMGGSWG